MKRTTPLKRTSRLRPVSKKRAASGYAQINQAYLREHPYCMATIASYGLREDEVIKGDGWALLEGVHVLMPRSTEIHHRNKARGSRRTDTRFFLAVCRPLHDIIEANKSWARSESIALLLPENADKDGVMPNGDRWPDTETIMRYHRGWGFYLPT